MAKVTVALSPRRRVGGGRQAIPLGCGLSSKGTEESGHLPAFDAQLGEPGRCPRDHDVQKNVVVVSPREGSGQERFTALDDPGVQKADGEHGRLLVVSECELAAVAVLGAVEVSGQRLGLRRPIQVALALRGADGEPNETGAPTLDITVTCVSPPSSGVSSIALTRTFALRCPAAKATIAGYSL